MLFCASASIRRRRVVHLCRNGPLLSLPSCLFRFLAPGGGSLRLRSCRVHTSSPSESIRIVQTSSLGSLFLRLLPPELPLLTPLFSPASPSISPLFAWSGLPAIQINTPLCSLWWSNSGRGVQTPSLWLQKCSVQPPLRIYPPQAFCLAGLGRAIPRMIGR